jgi:hypothetical protein
VPKRPSRVSASSEQECASSFSDVPLASQQFWYKVSLYAAQALMQRSFGSPAFRKLAPKRSVRSYRGYASKPERYCSVLKPLKQRANSDLTMQVERTEYPEEGMMAQLLP